MKKSEGFEYFKAKLKERLPQNIYKVWFSELKGFVQGKTLYLIVPNEFAKTWLKENYGVLLQNLSQEFGWEKIDFVVSDPPKAEQLVLPYNPAELFGRKISPKYTFEDFVVGKCNELAYKVCYRIFEERPKGYFIYLYGNYGLGKTHLTQAVGNGLLKAGFERVYYFTAQDFMSYLLKYLRAGQIESFKERIRESCDLLLLDGLHFLSGKEFTQTELSFLLDYLLDQGKTVIFTSLSLPQELKDIDSSLRSRLNASLIVRINQPDFETRKRIIRFKAKKAGYRFPPEVVDYLARNLRGDIRQIESAVIGLIARASLLKESVTLQLAKELLAEITFERDENSEVDLILEGVCKFYGLSKEEILSRSRKKKIVLARQTLVYLMRKLSQKTLKEISEILKKEHSTVIYHLKTFERKLEENRAFKMQIDLLIKDLSQELPLKSFSENSEEEFLEADLEVK